MTNSVAIGYTQFIVILAFGLPMVVHDIRYKKIPNKMLLKAFVSGIFLYILAYFFQRIDGHYLGTILVNLLFSIGVGYVFWVLNLWPAGDAKFFFFLSFMYPNAFLKQTSFVFAPLLILVNVFVIVSLVMLVEMLYRSAIKKNSVRDIQMAVKAKLSEIRKSGFLEVLLLIVKQVGFLLLVNYAIAFLMFLFGAQAFQFLPSKTTILSVAAFWIYTIVIRWHISRHEEGEIDVDEIKPGMTMVHVVGKIFPREFLDDLGPVRADGLTIEQAAKMKSFCAKQGVKKVNIMNNFAFSPWLLVGFFVTIFIRGSLIDLLVGLL